MPYRTDDVRIQDTRELTTPRTLLDEFPWTRKAHTSSTTPANIFTAFCMVTMTVWW